MTSKVRLLTIRYHSAAFRVIQLLLLLLKISLMNPLRGINPPASLAPSESLPEEQGEVGRAIEGEDAGEESKEQASGQVEQRRSCMVSVMRTESRNAKIETN